MELGHIKSKVKFRSEKFRSCRGQLQDTGQVWVTSGRSVVVAPSRSRRSAPAEYALELLHDEVHHLVVVRLLLRVRFHLRREAREPQREVGVFDELCSWVLGIYCGSTLTRVHWCAGPSERMNTDEAQPYQEMCFPCVCVCVCSGSVCAGFVLMGV